VYSADKSGIYAQTFINKLSNFIDK